MRRYLSEKNYVVVMGRRRASATTLEVFVRKADASEKVSAMRLHRKYVGTMFGDLGWSDEKLDWVARWDVLSKYQSKFVNDRMASVL